jgi:hypothetical protein
MRRTLAAATIARHLLSLPFRRVVLLLLLLFAAICNSNNEVVVTSASAARLSPFPCVCWQMHQLLKNQHPNQQRWHRFAASAAATGSSRCAAASCFVAAAATVVLLLHTNPAFAAASPSAAPPLPYQWQFQNGPVDLSEITQVGKYRLRHPILLGSGGGGAVFATTTTNNDSKKDDKDGSLVALKLSWRGSSTSVQRECQILNTIQERFKAVAVASAYDSSPSSSLEICLGAGPYSVDRTMIALQPVFVDEQAESIEKLPRDLQRTAIYDAIRTMVQLLSIEIVTADVQPLISAHTGHVLFIDFTEATDFLRRAPPFDDDAAVAAAAANFVAEMMALLPDNDAVVEQIASTALTEVVPQYPIPSRRVYDILLDQRFTPTALNALREAQMNLATKP